VGAEHGSEADRTDGDADAFAHTSGGPFDRGNGASPVARGSDRCGLIGPGQRAPCTPVDLDPAANDHVLEGWTLGGGAEDRGGGLIGEHGRGLGRGACIGFPHADMHEDMGIEIDDRFDDSIVLVGMNPMEYRTMEASPRRIGIDPRQRSNPILGLQETCHECAEFSADTADEHSTTAHLMNDTRTRRQIFGSALGLLGLGAVARWGSIAHASAPAALQQTAAATAIAERLRLQGVLEFPIQLPAELILLDNFGAPSISRAVHQGIDIGRRDQQPGHSLVACVDGVLAEQNVLAPNQGNSWVLVDDVGDGYRYHHLESFAPGLKLGDRVQRGQVIGTMGSTGNPNSPHLHFEVRRGGATGTAVDPVPLLGLPISGVTVA